MHILTPQFFKNRVVFYQNLLSAFLSAKDCSIKTTALFCHDKSLRYLRAAKKIEPLRLRKLLIFIVLIAEIDE